MKTCSATKTDGTRCKSPFVNESGVCPAHQPDGQARMRERAKKGGDATARRYAATFDAANLPPLDSLEAAQQWLEAIGRGVASDQLTDRQANAITKAVSEWIKSQGQLDAEQGERLRSVLAELRKRA